MELGLINYKNQLDLTKNKRAQTEKRLVQRQIPKDQLRNLQSKKVDLLDMDANLFKLNPHAYQQQEYVSRKIVELQVQSGSKPQEEIEKFTSYLTNKGDQKYKDDANILDAGRHFGERRFLMGQQREEMKEFPQQEHQYIKKYNFGVLHSALKTDGKFKKQVDYEALAAEEQKRQLAEALEQLEKEKEQLKGKKKQGKGESKEEPKEKAAPKGRVNDSSIDNKTQTLLNTSRLQLSMDTGRAADVSEPTKATDNVSFMSVFQKDKTIDPAILKDTFPNVDFAIPITVEKPKLKNDYQLLRRLSFINEQVNANERVKFDPQVREVQFKTDEYFAEEASVFRNLDELTSSIKYAQQQDKINMRPVDKQATEQIHASMFWSQNVIQFYKKGEDLSLIKQEKEESTLPVDMLDTYIKDDYHKHRFNNIFLKTTSKRDFKYFQGGNQAEGIGRSLEKLQNLKFHQFETQKDLDLQFGTLTPTELEQRQIESQNFVEQYLDRDLEQEEVLRQYQSHKTGVERMAQNKGFEIEQGAELLQRRFNSNQYFNERLQPNFNGVCALNPEKLWSQFPKAPAKQKKYSEEEKQRFGEFYTHYQAPLDVLHKFTNTYQQAIAIEQSNLQNEMELQRRFKQGPLPRPKFLANQALLDNNIELGNQHIDMKVPDKVKQGRYKYDYVPMDVVNARQMFANV